MQIPFYPASAVLSQTGPAFYAARLENYVVFSTFLPLLFPDAVSVITVDFLF